MTVEVEYAPSSCSAAKYLSMYTSKLRALYYLTYRGCYSAMILPNSPRCSFSLLK